MGAASGTYSESWYRVAETCVRLKASVTAQRQSFQGGWWYVLQDPVNNRFFRLRAEAYKFIMTLKGDSSIDACWRNYVERHPEEAPGQAEVIDILSNLHAYSLLDYQSASDCKAIFERLDKRRKQELKAKFMSFMFLRVPVCDPDKFLRRMMPVCRVLFSVPMLLLALSLVLASVKLTVENFDDLMNQGTGVLAADNLIYLYLCMAVLKLIHELAHALVCRYFSGEVHSLGLMFILFIPLPYMDATSSWAFKQRSQRILVSGAGIVSELFIAAIAVIVWANTGAGVINSLAFNLIFIASVSTLLFNANPLLKFDAYYMLSDAISIPNLYQRSRQQLTYLFERYAFGCRNLTAIGHTRQESIWLAAYGLLSIVYRFVIFWGIVLFVVDQYLILGLIMATFCAFLWFILPPFKLLKYLIKNPRIARRRAVAKRNTAIALTLLALFLLLIPVGNSIRLPGVVEATHYRQVNAAVSGRIDTVWVHAGEWVNRGDVIASLINDDIDSDYELARLALLENQFQQEAAVSRGAGDIAPLQAHRQSLLQKLKNIAFKRDQLLVKAPLSGYWSGVSVGERRGEWLPRGAILGSVYADDGFRFAAVVLQDENARLFKSGLVGTSMRFAGQENILVEATEFELERYQSSELPSAALSWAGGGKIASDESDASGKSSREPFFRMYITIPATTPAILSHGLSGELRVALNSEPLIKQWLRSFEQLIQKRYQI